MRREGEGVRKRREGKGVRKRREGEGVRNRREGEVVRKRKELGGRPQVPTPRPTCLSSNRSKYRFTKIIILGKS